MDNRRSIGCDLAHGWPPLRNMELLSGKVAKPGIASVAQDGDGTAAVTCPDTATHCRSTLWGRPPCALPVGSVARSGLVTQPVPSPEHTFYVT